MKLKLELYFFWKGESRSPIFDIMQGFHSVREVREFVRGSGKVREIRDFWQKDRKKNFYPCNFLKKNHLHTEMCVDELYMTVSVIINDTTAH